jgi:hypothetical protein
MMDVVYVALIVGLFVLSAFALKLFTLGQGRSPGREE